MREGPLATQRNDDLRCDGRQGGMPLRRHVRTRVEKGAMSMRRIFLPVVAAACVVVMSLGLTSALANSGRLQLYLVNSGPPTLFFQLTPPCLGYVKPAELATAKGVALQVDDPSGAQFAPSVFPYTVPA